MTYSLVTLLPLTEILRTVFPSAASVVGLGRGNGEMTSNARLPGIMPITVSPAAAFGGVIQSSGMGGSGGSADITGQLIKHDATSAESAGGSRSRRLGG